MWQRKIPLKKKFWQRKREGELTDIKESEKEIWGKEKV